MVSVSIVGGSDFLSGCPTTGIGDWFSQGVNETDRGYLGILDSSGDQKSGDN